MSEFEHFYARYGLALVMLDKGVHTLGALESNDFSDALEFGLQHFQLVASDHLAGKEKVTFRYARLPKQKGGAEKGIYLAPTTIATDLNATDLWKKVEEFKEVLKQNRKDDFQKIESVQQSYAPTAGEFNNGKASKQSAKIRLIEAICCAITTTNPDKPAFTEVLIKGKNPEFKNTAILPDLPLNELKHFITVFKRISKFKTEHLLEGTVSRSEAKGVITEKVNRPLIRNGNFPHAPKSSILSALGLLGAIGEWAKEVDTTGLAANVLQSLETCPIYIINADIVRVTEFNHFVVNLARKDKLSRIIDCIYFIIPYSWNHKSDSKEKDRDREKIAFFASRFMHLFEEMSFREFLAIRAEYPAQLEILFKTFFMEKKLIDPQVVTSARYLGEWLNHIAYRVAAKETPENVRETKAKILIELESSAFSAKTGSALIGQTVTRAGRLSKTDAPAEAQLFMEKTISGELELREAQQMLMAFSRMRSKFEPTLVDLTNKDGATDGIEDFADAQDNE